MKISKYFLFLILGKILAFPLGTKDTNGFPEGYIFAKEDWGAIYYKIYQKRNYYDAVKQCRKDGGTLPVPRSGTRLHIE